MHTKLHIFIGGIVYLGITDFNEKCDILKSMGIKVPKKMAYIHRVEEYKRRGEVPNGLNKIQLLALKKEVQAEIDFRRKDIQKIGNDIGIFSENEIRNILVPKKQKIETLLKFYSNKTEKPDITKAKAYPIENLVEFNRAGFARCPYHGPEKTPSFKWYPKENLGYCFGCKVSVDPIDVYQKLNNVSFIEAIKALSK